MPPPPLPPGRGGEEEEEAAGGEEGASAATSTSWSGASFSLEAEAEGVGLLLGEGGGGEGEGRGVGQHPEGAAPVPKGRVVALAAVLVGSQMGWALQTAFATPLFLELGASRRQLGFLRLPGPVAGLLVQVSAARRGVRQRRRAEHPLS